MENNITEAIKAFYTEYYKNEPESIVPLPESGSSRKYFRINGKTRILAVYNSDIKENITFIEFTKSFRKINLQVPEIYAISNDKKIYFLEDLGNITLYSFLKSLEINNEKNEIIFDIYKKIIDELIEFQVKGAKCIDYSYCYPRSAFDKQSMMWDLNYFKYYFLKLSKIDFDEQKIEDDFNVFVDYLLKTESDYFLYRDFQSRNIMLKNNQLYFIDYQGGRKGALQYDIASLLYDAKADLSNELRNNLLEYYIYVAKKYLNIEAELFKKKYYCFVLIRLMQAMGAYGYRGFYEQKIHFLQSIPYALKNLDWILNNIDLDVNIDYLKDVFVKLINSDTLKQISDQKTAFKVSINSFSYKRGIPVDETGNGGGFVFDCRAIPNPGKYEEYKAIDGYHPKVIEFLNKEPETHSFLSNVYSLVDSSIDKYLDRNFENLMINFGCTGGQHRSIFCTNALEVHLKEKYPSIKIIVRHREKEMQSK